MGIEHDIFSTGDNQHPVPRWHLHPGASSHKDTPPWDLLISHAPATGTSHRGCLGHTPGKTRPMTHRKILPDRLNPHHTPKTHAKISPVITTLSAPCALTIGSKRESNLTMGVQGYRLRQGNGSQAILPCNLSRIICIKGKH